MNSKLSNEPHGSLANLENNNSFSPTETTEYGLENLATKQELALNSFADSSFIDESISQPANITAEAPQELVFIDSAVKDKNVLIDNLSGATEVVVLDESKNEIVQFKVVSC